MFDVSSISNNFQLVNTINVLRSVNPHSINGILIENENYNINDKHLKLVTDDSREVCETRKTKVRGR